MKGRFEDKLAQLAFGDLSPEESARFEREVQSDPEALRALSMYKEMREGLRGLSDIPEDQFSKERLRDAILTQGLKPVPTRPASNRSWLWMPVAACVMGFAMMMAVNMTRKPANTQVVMGDANPSLGISTKDPIKVADRSFSTSPLGPLARPAVTSKPSNSGDADAKDPNEVDPRVTAHVGDEESFDPDLGSLPTAGADSAARTASVARNDSAASHTAGNSSEIVMIDEKEKDEQTGACKATVVGSSSNVLVGG